MTVTPASLRALYPEFGDTTKYPDTSINEWLRVAARMLDAGRWGDLLDFGVTLFVCHRIALAGIRAKAAAAGGAPGTSSGVVSSKSVDKVSISYDVATSSEEGGGHWNLTDYGKEWLRQARIVGAGPLTVGVDTGGPSAALNAYAGPGWYPQYGY
jgi:hypothetical protein